MQLVEQHIIKSNNSQYKTIDNAAFLSKNLYNATLYAVRQHFFTTSEYLSYATLQRKFQEENQPDYIALPRKVSQWVMKMVDQNFRAFFHSLTEFKKTPSKFKGKPKLPKYLEKKNGRFVLTFTNQAISKRLLDKEHILKPSGLDIAINTKLRFNQINQVRIVPRLNYYVAEIIYTIPEPALKEDNGKYAAIDLGINNFATVVSNIKGATPFVISGKEVKSYNRYYNKKKADLQSILDTRNKKKTSKQLSRLANKRENKIKDYLHKSTRYIVNQLVSNNITSVVVGKNKNWKQDINIGHVNNQNFVQLPHAKFIDILSYKCRLAGIRCIVNEESYTSKCSFLDGEEICKHDKYIGKRVKRGLFKSGMGLYINADVNGAYNILRKCIPNAYANGVEGVVVHPRIIKILN